MSNFILDLYHGYLEWFGLPATPTFYFLWILWFMICFTVYHQSIKFADKKIDSKRSATKNALIVVFLSVGLYFFNLGMTLGFIILYDFDGFLANAVFRSFNLPLGIILFVVAGVHFHEQRKKDKLFFQTNSPAMITDNHMFKATCFFVAGMFFFISGIRGILN